MTDINAATSRHSSPTTCYPIVRELRKLDEALRESNRNAALIMRGAANSLEKYEALKDDVRDIARTTDSNVMAAKLQRVAASLG